MKFDWDVGKARKNEAKHGVSFDEAETVFAPAKPLILDDLAHSDEEWRYVAMGFSAKQRLLVVFFARDNGVVRLISARKVTKAEAMVYAKTKRQSQ